VSGGDSAGTRRLRDLVRRFAGVRVLVVGDLMLDRFVRGRVERISPEAPVPVVHVLKEDAHPGGAGNVASNVAALGGRVAICGIVGADVAGRELGATLRAVGADVEGLMVSRDVATTQKTRIIAHQQQVVRLDHEEAAKADARVARRLRDFVLARRRRADVLVVSDYGKGVVGPDLLGALADAHRKAPFRWLVDPKRANFAHYKRPSLVKPNRAEAAAAAGVEIRDRASLQVAGRALLEQWECEAVVISRGEEGIALFQRRGPMLEVPTVAREVFDVTGAGDTLMATCALALGAGATYEEATRLANQAAGIVVGKVGTATVGADELRRELAGGA